MSTYLDWSFDILAGAVLLIITSRLTISRGKEKIGDLYNLFQILFYLGLAVAIIVILFKLLSIIF